MAEVVGVVASIAGLIQLTATVYGLLHTYIGGVNRADRDRQELLEELKTLSRIVVYLQGEVRENWGESPALQELCSKEGVLQGCALDCALELGALEARFRPNNRLISRLKWPLKAGETKEYIEKIERFKSTVNMALGLDHHAILRKVEVHTKSTNLLIQEYRAETQSMINIAIQNIESQADTSSPGRDAILKWIYQGDFNAKHYEITKRRQKGTGEWLLRAPEFVGWVEGKLNSRLLWGYGIPGAGKTFLSPTVIDRLGNTSTKFGLAHVYFDYKDQGRQTPVEVMSSLIRQLSNQIQDIPDVLEELYKKPNSDGKKPTLEELYNTLITISKPFGRVFFVFDALDECDPEKQRRELLPLFLRMGKSEDITIYIQEKIEQNPRARDLIRQGNYSGKIISKLEACANGMFLLVHLHIDYLCQQTTTKQILDALEKLETTSVRETSLYPTYDSAIERITSQHPPERELAIRILTWLVKAKRVLGMDEIREAVSIVPNRYEMDETDLLDERTLLEVCGGLVVTDNQTGSIRLAHYTVQEYLLQKSSSLNSDTELAIACVTYLSFDFFSIPEDDTTQRKEICKQHPFTKYSSEMMVYHLRSSEQRLTTEPFLRFLKKPYNINLLNAMRSMALEEDYWATPKHKGRSPVHIASDAGHLEVVKRLIEMGEEVLVFDYNSRLPLHVAAAEGQEAVLSYLLQIKHGRQLWVANIKGCKGYTALHEASSRGHERAVMLLLNKSLYPPWTRIHKLVNAYGHTTLRLAALDGHEAVVKLLLDKGADVNANLNITLLHDAARNGHDTVVKLLLEKGADVNAIDKWDNTALHDAAINGHYAVVKLLLEKGADVNAISGSGMTVLHHASGNGHDAVVKLLLEKGADVNAINKLNQTVLDKVNREPLGSGHREVIKLLLKNGAVASTTFSIKRLFRGVKSRP